jgi:uncharacterized protein
LFIKYIVSTKYFISDLAFDWGESKSKVNIRKHGVSFEEAQTAFYDENARLSYDCDHSLDEERYILLGLSSLLRLLVVCHVYREEKEIIRIISARNATKQENQQYRNF